VIDEFYIHFQTVSITTKVVKSISVPCDVYILGDERTFGGSMVYSALSVVGNDMIYKTYRN